jgi:hypothetical protein
MWELEQGERAAGDEADDHENNTFHHDCHFDSRFAVRPTGGGQAGRGDEYPARRGRGPSVTCAEEIERSRPVAGLFVCVTCRDEPSDECPDSCAMSHVEELPPVRDDYWPLCSCCCLAVRFLRRWCPLSFSVAPRAGSGSASGGAGLTDLV